MRKERDSTLHESPAPMRNNFSQKRRIEASQHDTVDNSRPNLFGSFPLPITLENPHFCFDQRGDEFLRQRLVKREMQRTECPHETVQLAVELTQNPAAVGKEREVVLECREPGYYLSAQCERRHLVGNLLFRVRYDYENAAPHLFESRPFRFRQRRDIRVDIGSTHGATSFRQRGISLSVFGKERVNGRPQEFDVAF